MERGRERGSPGVAAGPTVTVSGSVLPSGGGSRCSETGDRLRAGRRGADRGGRGGEAGGSACLLPPACHHLLQRTAAPQNLQHRRYRSPPPPPRPARMPGWRRNLTFCLQRMHEEGKEAKLMAVRVCVCRRVCDAAGSFCCCLKCGARTRVHFVDCVRTFLDQWKWWRARAHTSIAHVLPNGKHLQLGG